jgi:hypothetical protein
MKIQCKFYLIIRFNHRGPGSEHVSFESQLEVCAECGKPESSCFCPPDCDHCTQHCETQCICHLRKRIKLDHDSANNETNDDESPAKSVDVAILDHKTGLWTMEQRQTQDPKTRYDTCDMVLTRDVTGIRQLYYNYGNLNNQQLVSTYGFVDPACQTDFVSLQRELFYDTSLNIPVELRKLWMDHGFEIVERLVAEDKKTQAVWDELMAVLGPHVPTTGEDFVHWSLSTIKGGPKLTCFIWLFICWGFKNKKVNLDENELERQVLQLLLERFCAPPPDSDCTEWVHVISILKAAHVRRLCRYKDPTQALVDTSKRYSLPYTPEDRAEMRQLYYKMALASTMNGMEMGILEAGNNALLKMADEVQERCKVESHRHKIRR